MCPQSDLREVDGWDTCHTPPHVETDDVIETVSAEKDLWGDRGPRGETTWNAERDGSLVRTSPLVTVNAKWAKCTAKKQGQAGWMEVQDPTMPSTRTHFDIKTGQE